VRPGIRRNILRVLLCIAAIALGEWLTVAGMQHTIIFDNCKVTRNSIVFPAVEGVQVTIDGTTESVAADDRCAVKVIGAKNSVTLEFIDPSSEAGKRVVIHLALKFERTVIVSLPMLANGESNAFLPE